MATTTALRRPLAELRQRLSSALISDALDALGWTKQCLGPGIVPLDPTHSIVGFAFPVRFERVERAPEVPYVGLLKALDAVGRDDVYMPTSNAAPDVALWGELITNICKAAGAAGAICDGYVRDARQVRALDFPCFCRGTIPIDAHGRFEVTGHAVTITVDGVEIRPGDLVVADVDGVVVVPDDARDEAIEHVIAKATKEDGFREDVAGGMKPSTAFALHKVL